MRLSAIFAPFPSLLLVLSLLLFLAFPRLVLGNRCGSYRKRPRWKSTRIEIEGFRPYNHYLKPKVEQVGPNDVRLSWKNIVLWPQCVSR